MKTEAQNGNGGRHGQGFFRIVEFVNPSGAVAYRVTGWTREAERIRENFKTHGEAIARKQELEVQAANVATSGQTVFTRLTPAQVDEAETAFSALARLGHGSLLGAVDFYARNYRDPLKRMATSDAVAKFIAEKTAGNRRPRYLRDLREELAYLTAEHGRTPVHEIQKEDLVAVIDRPGRGPERQNNIRKDFRTFFNWCVANGFTPCNPAERVPEKTVEHGEIVTLPVAKVAALMDAAAAYKGGKLVPYLALATFCAIRPDEVLRLSWEQIDLHERQVTITASMAKKRGRRIVDIPENCLAWLRPHAARRSPIKPVNWRNGLLALKAKIGFGTPTPERPDLRPWPADVLRHTGISCHYREHGNEAQTAAWAGNSPDMIHGHYRALVSAREAKEFWSIVPDRSKIIRLPQVADTIAVAANA